MSVREESEEDRQKNSSTSLGLGLAAAAVFVGAGAALFYYFNRSPENPNNEGSTSSGWTSVPQTFLKPSTSMMSESESELETSADPEFTTVSENTTSDTSMYSSSSTPDSSRSDSSRSDSSRSDSIEMNLRLESSDAPEHSDPNDSIEMNLRLESSDAPEYSDSSDSIEMNLRLESSDASENSDPSQVTTEPDSRLLMEFEDFFEANNTSYPSTNSSVHSVIDNEWEEIPQGLIYQDDWTSSYQSLSNFVHGVFYNRHRGGEEPPEQELRREQKFRQRSWSLEECSICFEIMLNDQQLKALPCTHNFHSDCIKRWLDERQTCPVCRKQA